MSIHLKYLFNIFKKLNFYSRKTLHITGVGRALKIALAPLQGKTASVKKLQERYQPFLKSVIPIFFEVFFVYI